MDVIIYLWRDIYVMGIFNWKHSPDVVSITQANTDGNINSVHI